MAEVAITNKGIALVQEVMYQGAIRNISVFNDPQHNPTEQEVDLFNEVAANITDRMVDLWEVRCRYEDISDMTSERAKQIFHEIYESSV